MNLAAATTSLPPGAGAALRRHGLHGLLLLLGALALWFGWVGFIASDDSYYAGAGVAWIEHFPYVAHDRGSVRAMAALPVTAMVALLGESELTVTLGSCLFMLATLSLSYVMLSRIVPPAAAFAAALVLAVMPAFTLQATFPSADLPALFFVAASFWAFWQACQQPWRVWYLLLAGTLAGLAFSAHEITVALLAFYALLFLAGYAMPRRQYWIMALGFAIPGLVEAAYYGIVAGAPLHRFALLLEGASVNDRIPVGFLQLNQAGGIHVWDPIDPVVMLFTKHDFVFFGFAAVPALRWVVATRRQSDLACSTARLLTGLGLVWFVFAAVALRNLILMPRYYLVPVYCLVLVTAIWAAVALWPRRRALACAGAVTLVLAGLLAIQVSNRNPRFAERSLVRYLGTHQGLLHTDPMTADKSRWYCRWAGVDCSRVVADLPPPGAAYLHNPKNSAAPNRLVTAQDVPRYQPSAGWQVLWRHEEAQGVVAAFVERSGLGRFLPGPIHRKLTQPNPAVVVYRVPAVPEN